LLAPHRAYLDAVRELRRRADVRAVAHITGGGLIENVPRVLPEQLAAEVDTAAWSVPDLFSALQRAGNVHPEEMWRTFNMGIGMVVVVAADAGSNIPTEVAGVPVVRLGHVVPAVGAERVLLR
jgi:phosphoribosylaminoimidazole (AIR) synthetase